jgi:TetR/AcrR family transcriptional regulator, cholesterol catabolism regulator
MAVMSARRPAAPAGASAVPNSERREQVIVVAARLFSELGYRATTMRDLAAALNIKAGSLYSHISGKDELLWEIICRVADEFDAGVKPALRLPGDAPTRLRAALRAYVAVVARHTDLANVLFAEWRQLPPERQASIAARRDEVEGVFRSILRDGVAQGHFGPETDVRLSTVLALSGANLMPAWFNPAGPLTQLQVADQFTDLLLRGLEPRQDG